MVVDKQQCKHVYKRIQMLQHAMATCTIIKMYFHNNVKPHKLMAQCYTT